MVEALFQELGAWVSLPDFTIYKLWNTGWGSCILCIWGKDRAINSCYHMNNEHIKSS